MNILVTNDDGIYSEGIAALEEVASEFGAVTVVAPRHHHSGCSHQMTFEGHLGANDLGGGRHWVDGFPADCVRIAFAQLCRNVDLVVSGINHGSNLGLDNYLSGTVAAAREASFFGVPSIAFSQFHKGLGEEVWTRAKVMARRAMAHLIDGRLKSGSYWNVNFPIVRDRDPKTIELAEAPMDRSPLPNNYLPNDDGFTYTGDYHAREYGKGTDVAVCHDGKISMTLVCTGHAELAKARMDSVDS